jgi:hypothetical protein
VTVVLLTLITITFSSTSHARDKQYEAKQVNLKIDGNLGEWGGSDVIIFDELKDAGTKLPNEKDFSGSAMVGWNPSDPKRIYFAVTITDNELQDINPQADNFWEDDSMEFMFDFTNDGSLVQWNVAANGKTISSASTEENCEWIVVNKGDQYIFEVAIDPTKDNPAKPGFGKNFQAEVGGLIGLSIHFNDCENGTREHQIGWIPGQAWGAENFGDLIFSEAKAAVDVSGKLVTTWGNLKFH